MVCGYHYIFTLVRFETESIDKIKTAVAARNQELGNMIKMHKNKSCLLQTSGALLEGHWLS